MPGTQTYLSLVLPFLSHLGPQEDIPIALGSLGEVSQSDAAEKAIFRCSCVDRFLIFN